MLRMLVTFLVLLTSGTWTWAETRGAFQGNPTETDSPKQLYAGSFALVIGIDRYTNGWPRLEKAVADANAVGDELEARGFVVTRAHNLNSDQLSTTIRDFIIDNGEEPEARLLIWFAGHGHTLNGTGYLVPADAPAADKDSKAFRRSALNMGTLAVSIREPVAKHVLIVLDACFSGSVITSYRGATDSNIARKARLPVRQFITSGSADQVVPDDGRFRELFLRSIKGQEPRADQNKDGYVTGREIGEFLQSEVTNLTHEKQVPRIGTLFDPAYDDGDFIFSVIANPDNPAAPQNALPLSLCHQGINRVMAEGTIRFEIGGAEVSEGSSETLTALARIMAKCDSDLRFEVSAHTEAAGSRQYNLPLTRERALAIKRRLAHHGLDPNRMNTVGYGDTKPIAGNQTAADRIRNRRIEVVPFLDPEDLERHWKTPRKPSE